MASKKLTDKDIVDLNKLIVELADSLEMPPANLNRGTFHSNSISTGLLSFDLMLGGGIPGGRMTIFSGEEHGGKSTGTYSVIREAMARKTVVLHKDHEGGSDVSYMHRNGIKTDWNKEIKAEKPAFYYPFNPDFGEQSFDLMRTLMTKSAEPVGGHIPLLFVLDSLPAMLPEKLEGLNDTEQASLNALMFSRELPRVRTLLRRRNCTILGVNQLREKPMAKGWPWYEPCGNAPKFYSDIRAMFKKCSIERGDGKGYVEEEDCWDSKGNDKYNYIKIQTIKNRVAPSQKEIVMRIRFENAGRPGDGYDLFYDVFKFLKMTGQITSNAGKYRLKLPDSPFGDKTLYWKDLKEIVYNPDNMKDPKKNIRTICRAQIESGYAFERYYNSEGGLDEEEQGIKSEPLPPPGDDLYEEGQGLPVAPPSFVPGESGAAAP